jgi:putative transposase
MGEILERQQAPTRHRARRERVFFGGDEDRLYRDLLREACDKAGNAFCLTPNRIHLILALITTGGLARASGQAHRGAGAFDSA